LTPGSTRSSKGIGALGGTAANQQLRLTLSLMSSEALLTGF